MKRILIVEDDDDLRSLVERVFLDRGCEVEVARDGAASTRWGRNAAYFLRTAFQSAPCIPGS